MKANVMEVHKYIHCYKVFILIFIISGVFAIFIFIGNKQRPPIEDNSISADEAIEIAEMEIKKRETWNCPIRSEATRTAYGWSVHVYRLPKVAGGYRTIRISNKGKVLEYWPGI
jgi:hypothetical protein